jgi:cellulase/cellobiase CelA1
MLGIDSRGAAVGRGNLRNNIAYSGTLTSNMNGATSSNNSWDLGASLSDSQFRSVSTSGWDAPRQADGALPVLPHLRLAADSTLIDKGADVGLPYSGRAPDLGAFESGTPMSTPPVSRPPMFTPPSATPPVTEEPPGPCSAGYRTVNSWSGGHQAEVTVTAGGAAIKGWQVHWTLGAGQSITQIWNGTVSTSGSTVSARNTSYNGTLAAAGSVTFGLIATGNPSTPALACSSTS